MFFIAKNYSYIIDGKVADFVLGIGSAAFCNPTNGNTIPEYDIDSNSPYYSNLSGYTTSDKQADDDMGYEIVSDYMFNNTVYLSVSQTIHSGTNIGFSYYFPN